MRFPPLAGGSVRASPLTLVLPLTLSLRLAPEARSLLELVCTLRPGNSPFPPILREATCSIPNTNQLARRLLRVNELASTCAVVWEAIS